MKKSLLTFSAVFVLGLSTLTISSHKVSAAEVGKTETTVFNVKNVKNISKYSEFFENKTTRSVNRLAHTGYWGGGPLGGGESPENPFKGKLPDLYPWRSR